MSYLYEKINNVREAGFIKPMPSFIEQNLNPNFELRPYQISAFENFITYYENDNLRSFPTQTLFHMATGSGKTLIMAGLILYLYKQGYRNFLFFVNMTNIVDKTKVNFKKKTSQKYLFNDEIVIDGERIRINTVNNFQYIDNNAINICFTTTQGLHLDMWMKHENGITFDDFENKKVVLISDEAHHLNVETKKKLSAEEEDNRHSWEETVKRIFNQNRENILLEFTATCDLSNKYIQAEYENKIVYDYTLAKFYEDKYSKDILTMRSSLPVMDRALQALILSQYRLKVFQDNRLSIKPVVLFKAAKIKESQEFMAQFIETINKLEGEQLQSIYNHAQDNTVLIQAFNYFEKKGISFEELADELKNDFSEEHCISANDDNESTDNQLILNSLEDKNNPYRAIFEVKKLDEGWDVLNLFDIVRLYETRQSGSTKVSKATINEAQLIGRGARYCPFKIDDEQPKFQRKYDNDIDSELRICETLYYHCMNDHRYISELRNALKEIGLDPNKLVQKEYKLKDSFKDDDIYKKGIIFINNREKIDSSVVNSLPEKIRETIFSYNVETSVNIDRIMEEEESSTIKPLINKVISISEIAAINYSIVYKALIGFSTYKFSNLKVIFPNLTSMREFITNSNYMGSIKISISSSNEISIINLFDAVKYVASKVEPEIENLHERYKGTTEFNAFNIRDIIKNKVVNYTEPKDGGVGISQNDSSVPAAWKMDLNIEDWFAYTDNYGTSEEKRFVAYFKTLIPSLENDYEKIYLVRNERLFHIYSFEDGERFEPDYVLFLQKKSSTGYEQMQVFIEPKGSHLLEKDAWKEKFLLQIAEKGVTVKKYADDNEYRVWGVHFFNHEERMKEFENDINSFIK